MAITDIRNTPTSPPRTSRNWDASWTRSEPTSRSPGASGTPVTSAAPSNFSAGSWSAAESPCWRAGTRSRGPPGPACSAREDHREHGTRAQHHPWAMGLDERSGDPLHRMGVGHNVSERAMEEVAQLHPSQVHQHRRAGRRRRVRHHAGHPRPALGAEDIGNPIYNLLLGTLFEWGVALHGVGMTKVRRG